MIWKTDFSLEELNQISRHTMAEHIGIEIMERGDDFLVARMPVDHRTVQPFRLLHGGASAALAETLGSVAATLCVADPERETAVGVELNISHLRSATSGHVYATARPYRLGRRLQVWNIEIRDEQDRLISVSRLTMAVVPQKKATYKS
jgi:1,4-dihydroxy-2-naphthoyl-CoA hydrolase